MCKGLKAVVFRLRWPVVSRLRLSEVGGRPLLKLDPCCPACYAKTVTCNNTTSFLYLSPPVLDMPQSAEPTWAELTI